MYFNEFSLKSILNQNKVFQKNPKNSKRLQTICIDFKESKGIMKNLKDSKKFQKCVKISKQFQKIKKNPKNSKKIQKKSKKFKKIRKELKDYKDFIPLKMVEEFKLKKPISPPSSPLLSKNQRIRGAPAELAGAPKNLSNTQPKDYIFQNFLFFCLFPSTTKLAN